MASPSQLSRLFSSAVGVLGLALGAAACSGSSEPASGTDAVAPDAVDLGDLGGPGITDTAEPLPPLPAPTVAALPEPPPPRTPEEPAAIPLTLGCVVDWTTDAPGMGWVRVRPSATDEEWSLVAGPAEPTTTHHVTVLGLYVGDWDVVAGVELEDGTQRVSLPSMFTAGPLPEGLHDAKVKVKAKPGTDGSWFMTQLGFGLPWVPSPTFAVMFDLQGRVRWYAQNPAGPIGLATWLPGDKSVLSAAGGTIQEIAFDGTVLWTSPAEPEGSYTWWDLKDGTWHHDFRKLPNGNLAVLRRRNVEKKARDVLEEMDRDGKVVWAYDTTPINEAVGITCYGSSLDIDHARNKVVYAARASAVVAQLGLETGEIDWLAGSNGNISQEGDWRWFSDPHSPTLFGEDPEHPHLLLLDSGSGDSNRTRFMELELDLKAKSAKLVWEYPPAGSDVDVWFAPGGGSAERLPNGNTAIATMESAPDDPMSFARVRFMEINPAAQVVAHISLEGSYMIYRAQRVPPLLGTLQPVADQ